MERENKTVLLKDFWPVFPDNCKVTGKSVLDFVSWVSESSLALENNKDDPGMQIIAMPPVQRTAVWRPKQVLELWDSLMRGLPLGAFYLVDQLSGCRSMVAIDQAADKSMPDTHGTADTGNSRRRYTRTEEKEWPGFGLLDGQQRVRALLAGLYGEEKTQLCLWVELDADDAARFPSLRITSRAQPFGYDRTSGSKLSVADRRKARFQIEPDPKCHPIKHGDRTAYDFELFYGNVKQDGKKLVIQPPCPFNARERTANALKRTLKLHKLLETWLKASPATPEEGIAAWSEAFPEKKLNEDNVKPALIALDAAFRNVKHAQVALILVDSGSDEQTLLTLFERIGAAGTPLSSEERLFSIYKHYVPRIRDTVEQIFTDTGRVLTPTKITATALRIANSSLVPPNYGVPDVTTFAKEMAGEGEICRRLDNLLPIVSGDADSAKGLANEGFKNIRRLLSYSDDKNAYWLPDVMLVALPAELWQVLVFWMIEELKHSKPDDVFEQSRKDIVRFSLYWHIFVWDNERAARRSFVYLKKNINILGKFPAMALYQAIYAVEDGKRCGLPLIPPERFADLLGCSYVGGHLICSCSPELRNSWERFGESDAEKQVVARWWWSAKKVLPWLQRDYVLRKFSDYKPLTDHEDDLPYDIDHVLPAEDWDNWKDKVNAVNKRQTLSKEVLKKMQLSRRHVGDGIGNMRLISSTDNRHDQDDDIKEKAPELVSDGDLNQEELDKLRDMAFSPDQRALWKRASSPEKVVAQRIWTDDRLAAFQQAVEQRAVSLYAEFYNSLSLGQWASPITEELRTIVTEETLVELDDDQAREHQ